MERVDVLSNYSSDFACFFKGCEETMGESGLNAVEGLQESTVERVEYRWISVESLDIEDLVWV